MNCPLDGETLALSERREQFDRPSSDYDRGYKKPHKKKSFLSEMFEFGD
jgi:hypothetical protein